MGSPAEAGGVSEEMVTPSCFPFRLATRVSLAAVLILSQALSAQPASLAELEEEVVGRGYSSPVVVPAAAFHTMWNGDGRARLSGIYGYWRGFRTDNGVEATTAVDLPDGSAVTAIFALVYDNTLSGVPQPDVAVWMDRVDNYAGIRQQMVELTTVGADSDIQVLYEGSPNNATVLHPIYSYYVTVRLGDYEGDGTYGHRFYGVIVSYTESP